MLGVTNPPSDNHGTDQESRDAPQEKERRFENNQDKSEMTSLRARLEKLEKSGASQPRCCILFVRGGATEPTLEAAKSLAAAHGLVVRGPVLVDFTPSPDEAMTVTLHNVHMTHEEILGMLD